MKRKLDAATMKRLAPGAALMLLAGPLFLFLVMDLIIYVAISGRGGPTAAAQVADLSMEIVLCLFTGLVAAFGARMVWRVLKE
jgi:hypothetical protein